MGFLALSRLLYVLFFFFFFNDPAPPEIYPLPLHDALPILFGRFPAAIFHPEDAAIQPARLVRRLAERAVEAGVEIREHNRVESLDELEAERVDRKSTRLNSSHGYISYAVFCL